MFESCIIFFRRYCLKSWKLKEDSSSVSSLEISDLNIKTQSSSQKIERNLTSSLELEIINEYSRKNIVLSKNQKNSAANQNSSSEHDWVIVDFHSK